MLYNFFINIFTISIGAAVGASIRYLLGLAFNPIFSSIQLGTLVANYLGCFIIGVVSAFFWSIPSINPHYKLLIITGFLGSLTTFSSFSLEVVENIMANKYMQAINISLVHLLGSIAFTLIGIFIYKALLR